jgi:hypothetical protein
MGIRTSAGNAQGIGVEIPQTLPEVKLRNWNGKPGPARSGGCAQIKNFMRFLKGSLLDILTELEKSGIVGFIILIP